MRSAVLLRAQAEAGAVGGREMEGETRSVMERRDERRGMNAAVFPPANKGGLLGEAPAVGRGRGVAAVTTS